MPADFSRKRSILQNHAYVELKQGAVLLDSDFNESSALVDRASRALASGIMGRAAVSQTTPQAFQIDFGPNGLRIGKGRLYVDGLLAENHGAPSSAPVFDDLLSEPSFQEPVAYAAQPFLPKPAEVTEPGRYLMYLDVWQREVTQLEQPDLVEIALGVEASARVQTVWQVNALKVDGATDCTTPDSAIQSWQELIAPSSGRLTTGTFEVAAVDDPCELPPTGGYRGLENQLYRLEIHDPGQPGQNGATFKWSREGGSVGSAVTSILTPSELELASLGRDDVLGFKSNDWVEVLDDDRELSQRPGEMRRITVTPGTRVIQLDRPLPPDLLPASPREGHMRVRLWNQAGPVLRTDPSGTPVPVDNLDAPGSTGVIAVPPSGTTLLLEHGVTVSFSSVAGGAGFKTGDYWLFAARTADASVELLDHAPPRGIHHHFARLAIWDSVLNKVSDCRVQWPPAGKAGDAHDCSCTVCVSPASHNEHKLTLQQAVDSLLRTGGTICLGVGDYKLDGPVRIVKGRSLSIRGQGGATRIFGSDNTSAFIVEDSRAVAVEALAVHASGAEPAIAARNTAGLSLKELDIEVRSDTGAAIALEGVVVGATIRDNSILAPVGLVARRFAAPPTLAGAATGFLLVEGLRIEDNAFSCRSRGIDLAKEGIHMASLRITGNQITGCEEVGVSALGIGLRDSLLTISGNRLSVLGDGVLFSAQGAWIEQNQVVRGDLAAKGRVGIGFVAAPGALGTARCQIIANQVSGFAGAGIQVTAPSHDLIVKLNIIEHCGNGIISTGRGGTASLSIENNHLRNIDSDGSSGAEVVGIFVAQADSATVSGNSIHSLGVVAATSLLRVGILIMAVRHSKVADNELSEVASSGGTGKSAGIMLHAPYSQFSVHHNQVERDTAASTQPAAGEWFALVTTDKTDASNGVAHTAGFATLAVGASTVVLGAGRPSVATFVGPTGKPEGARGSVLGNVLQARGGHDTPAVVVKAAEECRFSDNRVELSSQAPFAVVLDSAVPIVNANRVLGGTKSSIDIRGTHTASVLGNVTSTAINLASGPLQTWPQLNIVT